MGIVHCSALSFVSAGNNIGVVANIVHVVFIPLTFRRRYIVEAKCNALCDQLAHYLDREVDVNMVNR